MEGMNDIYHSTHTISNIFGLGISGLCCFFLCITKLDLSAHL